MGEGEPPALPGFDCFTAPEEYTFAFKGLMECNWLQALEVGIDPAHASYLHRFFEDASTDESYGKQFRGATMGADMPMTKILREYGRPQDRGGDDRIRHADRRAAPVERAGDAYPHHQHGVPPCLRHSR